MDANAVLWTYISKIVAIDYIGKGRGLCYGNLIA